MQTGGKNTEIMILIGLGRLYNYFGETPFMKRIANIGKAG
jgi:hypothetical protein